MLKSKTSDTILGCHISIPLDQYKCMNHTHTQNKNKIQLQTTFCKIKLLNSDVEKHRNVKVGEWYGK